MKKKREKRKEGEEKQGKRKCQRGFVFFFFVVLSLGRRRTPSSTLLLVRRRPLVPSFSTTEAAETWRRESSTSWQRWFESKGPVARWVGRWLFCSLLASIGERAGGGAGGAAAFAFCSFDAFFSLQLSAALSTAQERAFPSATHLAVVVHEEEARCCSDGHQRDRGEGEWRAGASWGRRKKKVEIVFGQEENKLPQSLRLAGAAPVPL